MKDKTGKNTCYQQKAEYKTGRCVQSFDLLFPSVADPKLHSVHISIDYYQQQQIYTQFATQVKTSLKLKEKL